MKLQALMIAVALAAGTAFAQAPNTTAKPAESSTLSAGETMDKAPAKVHKKKVEKKKVHKQHASAKHHRQHAKAGMHSSTHAMGAGRAGPATDLDAKARQDRMDQAYANWQAKR
jgi:hypothetical protein